MNRVAAIAAGAFDWTRVPLFASAVAAGANLQPKSAVGQRPCCFQYRPHGRLKFGPDRSRRHWPYKADTSGNSPELLSVASHDADRSVYQLMAQDRRHLHRHQVFRLAQVRPDENLKMAILAALIIPALTDMLAAPPAGGESNRDTQLRRQWSPQGVEYGRHALGDIVQPSFTSLMQLNLHGQLL